MIPDPELVARRFGPEIAADVLRRLDVHNDPEMTELAGLVGQVAAVALALDGDVQLSGADALTAKRLARMSAGLARALRLMGVGGQPSLLALILAKVSETSSAVLEAMPAEGTA